jgi:hypothetical protein
MNRNKVREIIVPVISVTVMNMEGLGEEDVLLAAKARPRSRPIVCEEDLSMKLPSRHFHLGA